MIAQAIKVSRMVEADRHKLAEENEHLRDELRERYAFRNIIGNSAPIQQVYEQVAQVARTNTTVLIRGESGTGKEMIAHAIHYNSPRAKKPFIKVSAAALPESLIESSLFGHRKGAFTGATEHRDGAFGRCRPHGSVFLDEIGDVPVHVQSKLLRVLQERTFVPLGGVDVNRFEGRIIAATSRPMDELIAGDAFRVDLYYRLAANVIELPTLRARIAEDKTELTRLVAHLCGRITRDEDPALARDVHATIVARLGNAGRRDVGQRSAPRACLAR